MDKTILRHKIRRHAFYKDGESFITDKLNNESKCRNRLINQWLNFCIWLIAKGDHHIENIQSITREDIIRYGQYLKFEFDNGRYASTHTVASYLSGMNTVMKLIHSDWQKVRAVQDCGIASFSYIPNTKPKLDKHGLPDIDSLASYLLELQASLGVTVREALLLDLKVALKEGRTTGLVTVTHFQNGMRRKVPCRPTAIKAIGHGLAARRLQKHLTNKMEFDDFLTAHNKLAARKGYSTNTARGIYVRDRYQELTGVSPPIITGLKQEEHWQTIAQHSDKTLSEAKGIDKNSRHQIAKEIGVLGTESLKDYLDQKI